MFYYGKEKKEEKIIKIEKSVKFLVYVVWET